MLVQILSRPVLALLLALGSVASAHATLVLGTFTVTPAQPEPGTPVTLELTLEDPTQVPVQDAYVFAELRPEDTPDAEPVRGEFQESETPGLYRATVTLPDNGNYQVLLRDQTYRQEEASATLETPLRLESSNAPQDFIFPPTATGAAGWRSWLLWLIGLPVVAAVVVTVLVLTRGEGQGQQEQDETDKSQRT